MAVVNHGGRRKPGVHPELAAWQVIRASLAGEDGPVVARCEGCGQPMTSDQPLEPLTWGLQGPEGPLVVEGGAIRAQDGSPRSIDEVDRALQAHYREPIEPGRRLFEGAMLSAMAVPILLWGAALFFVLWFLYNTVGGTVAF